MASSHAMRFSDWSLLERFSRLGTQETSLRSFFNGGDVSTRMTRIREAITWIRTHWMNYDEFIAELKESFLGNNSETSEHKESTNSFALFEAENRKAWADRAHENEIVNDFGFLKLYTSEDGYRKIFSVLNGAFRTDSLLQEEVRLRAAVFLVELLTIDLFNYTYFPRERTNLEFTGIVYRGMSLSQENLEDFMKLITKPVEERYWSIPLAFISCTMERARAVDFAERVTSMNPDLSFNRVLLRVHVAGLDKRRLEIYSSKFPSSVVTPICAVDISNISEFPEEREVVLRGPFFQLVNISEWSEEGKPWYLLDVLVFNSNRDHPSTMEMEEIDGNKARALFACLIEGARAEKCIELAKEMGKEEDLETYDKILERAEVKLAELLS